MIQIIVKIGKGVVILSNIWLFNRLHKLPRGSNRAMKRLNQVRMCLLS